MDYFKFLRARLPFPAMQAQCHRYDLPSAQGWDKLEEKLEEASNLNEHRHQEIAEILGNIFRDALPVGNRSIQIHKFEPEVIRTVSDYLSTLAPEESHYLDSYPKPRRQTELTLAQEGLFLCEIIARPESVTLIFATKRLFEEREPRSKDQISDEAINRFGWQEYDEFILIKRQFIQCYEIVRVDRRRNLIELRVEEHTGADTNEAMNSLRVKANLILANRFGEDFQLINPINLFPAISSMYNDEAEGVVVELGFTTATGSAKHEKMRQRNMDLRTELFHVGGKAAINGALTPFRIAVRWFLDGSDRMQEEVLLPGSIRQLASSNPYLDHMCLKGLPSEAAMDECIERVVRHLHHDEE